MTANVQLGGESLKYSQFFGEPFGGGWSCWSDGTGKWLIQMRIFGSAVALRLERRGIGKNTIRGPGK